MNNTPDDIVAIAPETHETIFENDQIRMLKVTVKPGEKVPTHTNPENINYVLKGAKMRFTSPDGSSQEVEVTEGQVAPAPVSTHSAENIGDTELQTICVEMKTPSTL